ncbi:DUF6887 family protein [Tolypothrix sp. VBCCA 56010]|uniref:DUF6887 family protein n=1 Tax=Tolypothrix sp. VBCCA 56010 TaxID=3137731 RepID=UPI003D7DF665
MSIILSFTSFGSGTGKDTAIDYIVGKYGFVRFAWASILRRAVAKGFSGAPEYYTDEALTYIEPDKDWEAESGFTQALIDYHDHEGVTQLGAIALTQLSQRDVNIAVLATRLVSQYDLAKAMGAKMVLIHGNHRRGIKELDQCLVNKPFDVELHNIGTVEEFYKQLDKLVFATMPKSELKRYVLEHRHDNEAFYALADRIDAEQDRKFYTIEDAEAGMLEKLIEAKRQQSS